MEQRTQKGHIKVVQLHQSPSGQQNDTNTCQHPVPGGSTGLQLSSIRQLLHVSLIQLVTRLIVVIRFHLHGKGNEIVPEDKGLICYEWLSLD